MQAYALLTKAHDDSSLSKQWFSIIYVQKHFSTSEIKRWCTTEHVAAKKVDIWGLESDENIRQTHVRDLKTQDNEDEIFQFPWRTSDLIFTDFYNTTVL